jgi:hypothetical protein
MRSCCAPGMTEKTRRADAQFAKATKGRSNSRCRHWRAFYAPANELSAGA